EKIEPVVDAAIASPTGRAVDRRVLDPDATDASGFVLRVAVADESVPDGMTLGSLVVKFWSGCDEAGECETVRELLTGVDWETGELVVHIPNRVLALSSTVVDPADGPPARAQSNSASYYGIGASTSTPFGDYSALPGSLSSYQVGVQTGHAEAGYSFTVPPAVGPSPSVGLSYSSGVVDNFTSSENGQAGLVGLGWSLSGSQISRAMRSCSDNDANGDREGNNCLATGTLDDGFSISLNGVSSRLAKIEGASGTQGGLTFQEYRLESDPGWRVRRITDAAPMPDAIDIAVQSGTGYWLVDAGGHVHSFGSASWHGNTPTASNFDTVSIAGTPSGNGYWLVTSNGEVYTFGDATFHGGVNHLTLSAPIMQIEPTPNGGGYWLLGEDGAVYTFGNAGFSGRVGSVGNPVPVKAIEAVDSSSYYILQTGGYVHAFGNATDYGDFSAAPYSGVEDIVVNSTADGYWLVKRDGWMEQKGAAAYPAHSYGVASDFVFDVELDPNGGAWHLQKNGIVRAAGGADWTEASLGHTTRDHWEVTTPEGTVYTFGEGRTPTLGRETNSVDTVPVYVPGSGCRADLCDTAYAWHLDKTTDTVGNAQYRFYTQETNWYLAKISSTGVSPRKYVRASRPFGIEYGNAPGTSDLPSSMVYFTYTAADTDLVPDYACSIFNYSCGQTEPAFYTSQRLDTVQTWVRDGSGAGSGWRDVGEWVLDADKHSKPKDTGDTIGNGTYLRLNKITQQGINRNGSSGAMPSVNYTYTDKANRADGSPSGGVSKLYTSRLSRIENELGGWVDFTYGQTRPYKMPNVNGACTPLTGNNNGTSWQRRTCDIFPQWVRFTDPNTETVHQGWAVFNKWKVLTQTVTARWGSTPATTSFDYAEDPQWAYTQGFGNHNGYSGTATPGFGHNVWSQYRGHNQVNVTSPDGSITEHYFYTGMHGDPVASGSSAASVTYNGASYTDYPELAGRTIATVQRGVSASHPELGAAEYVYERHQYDSGDKTAFGWPTTVTATWPDVRQINTTQVTNARFNNSGTRVATTQTNTVYNSYGNATHITNHGGLIAPGDTTTTGDETITEIKYKPNTTAWIVSLPYMNRTWASTAVNVGTTLDWQTFNYDRAFNLGFDGNYPAPTQGLLTHTKSALNINGGWVWPVTRTQYNSRGQVTATRNPEASATEITTAGYDSTWGYQEWVNGPLPGDADRTTFNTVDPAFGTIEQVTAPNNQITTATYDWAGRLATVKAPGAPANTAQYGYYLGQGAASVVTTSTLLNPNEYANVWTFVDGFGRQLQTQTASAAGTGYMTVQSNSFDHAGRPHRSSAPYDLGLAGTQTPGGQGYIDPAWTSLISYSEIDYNPGGVEGKVTTHQMSKITSETSASVTVNGLVTTSVDPLTHTTTATVDALGRTISTTDQDGANTTFVYDTAGQLDQVTDDVGNITNVAYYYPGGLKSSIVDPDSGQTSYTYDLMGRLRTQSDANSNTLWFDYHDQLGVQTQLRENSSTGTLLAQWNYHTTGPVGLLHKSKSHTTFNDDPLTITVTNEYDNRQRLNKRTWDIPVAPDGPHSFEWTYRESGNVDTIKYPDGETLTHSYDVLEQPTSLVSSVHGDLVRDATYTPYGAMSTLLIGNGNTAIDMAYDYNDTETGEDGTLRLKTLQADIDNSDELDYAYEWDDNGNLIKLTDSGNGIVNSSGAPTTQYQCFQYTIRDELDQAYTSDTGNCSAGYQTGQSGPDLFNIDYDYNSIGNITKATGTGTVGGDGIYTYGVGNAGPHAVTEAGNNTYAYDAVGNMTDRNISGQAPQHLSYNSQNRLTKVTEGANPDAIGEFVYDADGVRVVRRVGDVTTFVINELYEIEIDATPVGGASITSADTDSADIALLAFAARQTNVTAEAGGTVGVASQTALMVTGNTAPGANDVPVKNQLEALGFTVTIKTASGVTAADATGKDIVVITSTFAPADLGTKLKNITVPILQFEPWAYDENEYTPNQAGKRGETSTTHTQVVIADPNHTMAAGLSGTATVTTQARKLSYGVPASDADIIATVPGDSAKAVIFGYDTGDTMDSGFTAPARRVGFFFIYNSPAQANTNGWALFDAAINWATGTSGSTNQAPVVDAGTAGPITLPTATVTLDGTVTDDGLPTAATVTQTWTKLSGPGTVTFGDNTAEDTTATFSTDGTYVLELEADDTEHTNADTLTVVVNPTSGGGGGGQRVTTGLVALYEFDETTGTNVADTSGYASPLDLTIGTPANVTWTGTGALDVTGNTLISSGSAASKISNAVIASDEITVEAWIEPGNLTQNGPARIVTISDTPSSRNTTIGQGVYNNGSDRIEARLRTTGTGANGTPATQTPTGSLGTSLQHVVFTRDSTGVTTVYIDGTVAQTGTASGNMGGWDTSYQFGLAAELDNSRYWHGTYHLVAVYDQALNATEVGQNYTAGANGTSGGGTNQAPVTNAGADQTITLPNSATLTGTATDDGLPTGSTLSYTWTQTAGPTATINTPNSATTTVTFPTHGTYSFQLEADDTELTDIDALNITVNPAPGGGNQRVTAGLVALYEFDETGGTTVADTSGNGTPLNLTITTPANTTWTGGGLDVTGNTLINSGTAATKIHTAVTASDEITIEAWIDPANLTQNGPARIVTISNTPSTRNTTLGQGVYASTGDRIEARLRTTGTSSNGTPATQTGSILNNNLQHVVYTRNNTGVTNIYIDGVLDTTSTATGNMSGWDTTYQLALAAELDNTRHWHGTYELIAIYDQALDSAEVTQNYTAGANGTGPTNQPPTVNAGPDQTIALPNTATLNGTITDDGLPTGATVTHTWTKISGPGTVTFTNPNTEDTTATFSQHGTYTLKLEANDTQHTANDQIEIEVTPQPTTRSHYTFGGTMIGYSIDGTLTTTATGHLDSTEITNTGTTIARQTYLPFGGVRNASSNGLSTDHTFTGQVDDDLGWMHYRARQYDPTLARFMQADSIVADGLNRYAYVLNGPLGARDPTGTETCKKVTDGDGHREICWSEIENIGKNDPDREHGPDHGVDDPAKRPTAAEYLASINDDDSFTNPLDYIYATMMGWGDRWHQQIPIISDLVFASDSPALTAPDWWIGKGGLDFKPEIIQQFGMRSMLDIEGETWSIYHDIWANISWGYLTEVGNNLLPNATWQWGHQQALGGASGKTTAIDPLAVAFGQYLGDKYGDALTVDQFERELSIVLPVWEKTGPPDYRPRRL
ncbi:MAG: hypothetical protein GY926_19800, partial [bacterium]|nr:hypothetical protein [bacterium]